MGAGEGSSQDFTIHGNPQPLSIQLFELLQRPGFAVLHGLERSNPVGIGGFTEIFLAGAWWGRDIDLGMISRGQNPNVNALFLENNRPRKRE